MRTCTVFAVLIALATLPGCIVVAPKSRAVSTQGLRDRLPVRSELRLNRTDAGWAVVRSALTVHQVGDSIIVRVKGHILSDWDRPDDGEGIVPIASFRAFWDSLGQLGFWQLGDAYSAHWSGEGGIWGQLSIEYESTDHETTAKTVRFSYPEACSLRFRHVYHLSRNMARFAPPVLDTLKGTLAPAGRR